MLYLHVTLDLLEVVVDRLGELGAVLAALTAGAELATAFAAVRG